MNIKKGPLGFPAKRFAKKCENANCENIITKCENFVKNHELYSSNNWLLKRTCGIFCSAWKLNIWSLLCHINNFSSLTLTNIWWREFDINNAKFSHDFFATFLHYLFREICAWFFREIFAFSILNRLKRTKCENKAKWSQKKICEKYEIFVKRFFLLAGNPRPYTEWSDCQHKSKEIII